MPLNKTFVTARLSPSSATHCLYSAHHPDEISDFETMTVPGASSGLCDKWHKSTVICFEIINLTFVDSSIQTTNGLRLQWKPARTDRRVALYCGVYNTIRLWFDSRSIACRRSLSSQWHYPLATVHVADLLFIYLGHSPTGMAYSHNAGCWTLSGRNAVERQSNLSRIVTRHKQFDRKVSQMH